VGTVHRLDGSVQVKTFQSFASKRGGSNITAVQGFNVQEPALSSSKGQIAALTQDQGQFQTFQGFQSFQRFDRFHARPLRCLTRKISSSAENGGRMFYRTIQLITTSENVYNRVRDRVP
jgi:hypothetical protein